MTKEVMLRKWSDRISEETENLNRFDPLSSEYNSILNIIILLREFIKDLKHKGVEHDFNQKGVEKKD